MDVAAQGVFDFCREKIARPKRAERLFFALLPDAQASLRIVRFAEAFAEENGLRGTRTKADRLHVSLQRVGDFKHLRSETLGAAIKAGDAVSMRSFEMTFHSIGSFGPARADGLILALIGGGGPLNQLHETLGTAIQRGANTQFAPHMTLLYGSAPVAIRPIEPIRFAVKDVVLVHSARGLGKYNLIHRWPLLD